MKKISLLVIGVLINLIVNSQSVEKGTQLFDSDWRFHYGGAQGAEMAEFDDSGWRKLNLPHDWSIEDLPGTDSPFSPNAISQVSGGFTTGGTGWYRKRFILQPELSNQRVIIQFDGVYMNPEIYINGVKLGNHPYGYTSFWFDITDKLKFDQPNVLALKVRNEGENSRWYSGSGIYRHVWLKVLEPVHVEQWGVTITTPEVTKGSATVNVKTKVINSTGRRSNVRLIGRILNEEGVESGLNESELIIENDAEFNQNIVINKPVLWSIDNPVLYTSVNEIFIDGVLNDHVETKFGIRTIAFDTLKGFQLNGESLKLKGGCFHHDNGPLGARSYDRAEERRVELLKSSGFNAIRCSHNPPSPAFLDACDRLGMVVIDETFDMWQYPKNPNDYNLYFEKWWKKDVESMILRDRNHPSVILWSIGNEIPGMDNPEIVNTAKLLGDYVRSLDPTRPVIAAVNNLNPAKDPFFETLDIAGYNYGSGGDHLKENIFYADHQRIPARIMVQTESYPLEAFSSWMDVTDYTWLLGDFVWTAFDYIGEASIGWRGYMQEQSFYPWNLAFCGDIDICGWKRPQSYYRDALWKPDQLSIFVKPPVPSFEENKKRMFWSKWHWDDAVADWNWEGYENQPIEVSVYSSCMEAELFLNGKSLGKKRTDRSTEFKATWEVPYQDGELKAVGYKGKKKIITTTLLTADKPSQIILSADRSIIRANGQDLSYITVEVVDKKGIRNPKAENLINFEVEGPGTIVGIGNANPISVESCQGYERKAWQGRCLVIIKSDTTSGDITLKATSAGFEPKIITVHSSGD